MEGQSGMETAQMIREFDSDLMIVFVTGHADYVFDGYRTGALDYLMKPVKTQKLMELLHSVSVSMIFYIFILTEERSFSLRRKANTLFMINWKMWKKDWRNVLSESTSAS